MSNQADVNARSVRRFCQACATLLLLDVVPSASDADEAGGFSCPACKHLNRGRFGGTVVAVRRAAAITPGATH